MLVDLFYELSLPDFSQLTQAALFAQTLDEIELADGLGFDAVWLVEHHFMPGYSYSSAPDLFLAAASQRTKQIRLGYAIIPLPYHHPIHIAERIASLDVLSHGRVEFGFGRGFQPKEYQAFAVDMQSSRQLTMKSLQIIKLALGNRVLNYQDDLYQFKDLEITPRCIQTPHPPLWMATVSPQSFDIAAELGVNALCGPFKPWFMIKEDIKRYKVAVEGNSLPSKIAMTVGFFCHEDAKVAKELAKPALEWFYRQLFGFTRPILKDLYQSYEYYHRYRFFQPLLDKLAHFTILEKLGFIIVGNPEHCRKKLLELKRSGVDRVLLSIGAGGTDTLHTQQCLKLTRDEILPYI